MIKVSEEEKKLIWKLYFWEMYSYEDLEKFFEGKYDYHQLKSIVMLRYKENG